MPGAVEAGDKGALRAVPSARIALATAGVSVVGVAGLAAARERPLVALLLLAAAACACFAMAWCLRAGAGVLRMVALIALAWGLSLGLVGAMAAVAGALAYGRPEGVAARLGVTPASVRGPASRYALMAFVPSAPARAANQAAPEPGPAVPFVPPAASVGPDGRRFFRIDPSSLPSRPTQPRAIMAKPFGPPVAQMSFGLREHDDRCDADRVVPLQWCFPAGQAIELVNWDVQVHSANCGSRLENLRKEGTGCLAADARVLGCGYEGLFGLKNCKGHGWLDGTVVLKGSGPARP